jgi:hypothetical protein
MRQTGTLSAVFNGRVGSLRSRMTRRPASIIGLVALGLALIAGIIQLLTTFCGKAK